MRDLYDVLQPVFLHSILTFPCSIDLPVTVTESTFKRELDFYGINAEEDTIKQESLARAMKAFHLSKSKHDMFFLALEAHYQYGMKKTGSSDKTVCISIKSDHKLYDTRTLSTEERDLFENYLDKYFGLQLHGSNKPSRSGGYFYVSLKE